MGHDDRARGVLLGLACGDALGRPVEFKTAEDIERQYGSLTEMEGYGTWGQPAGTITDDTEQALCIARSLAERETFDPEDIADRFVQWYESGPFDIGVMTRQSLQRLQRGESWENAGQAVWEASPEGSNAGNGSVMRCAPLALAFRDDPETLAQVSKDSSRITHADPRCTYGCAVLNHLIAGFLTGKEDPLERALDRINDEAPDELLSKITTIIEANHDPALSTSGYVIHTLQTAIHDALDATSVEEAIVTTVNRGGDTDTIGAVTGAIAGARFGAEEIPSRWRTQIDASDELTEVADRLTRLQITA